MSATNYDAEIYDKLQHIRKTFVQKNMQQSPFFGAFADATFGTESLPGRLLKGYASGFAPSYAASVRADVTSANIAGAVKYRGDLTKDAFAAIPAATGGVPIAATLPGNRYVDLNLAGLLATPTAPPKLGEDLDDVAIVYSVLDDENYAAFAQGGDTLKVAKYTAPGAPATYTLNAARKTYMIGTNPATRLDALLSKISGASAATTADIALGRYAAPGMNSLLATTTEVTPPTGTADAIVSLSPAEAASSFEIFAPPVALAPPPEGTGVTTTYTVTGHVRLLAPPGTIPAGTTTSFSVYLRRGNLMELLSTPAPQLSTTAWTPFTYTTRAVTASDAPIQLVLSYKHSKTWTKVLLTNFRVVSQTVGEGAAADGAAASVFTTDTDLFVVRRLLLLYTLMSNFYIAMTVYDRMYTASATAEPAAARNLLSLTYQNLVELNRNVVRSGSKDDNSDSVNAISDSVNARIQDFYRMGKNINKLGEETTQKKTELRDDLVRMKTTGEVKDRSARYAIATIVLASVVAVVLAFLLAIPSTPLVKVAGTAAVLLLASLLTLAIRKLYDDNVPEAFADAPGALVYNLPDYPGGLAASNKTQIMTYYESAFARQVSEYLSNTIYLALLLQSHRAYGNVNFSMGKEERYYTDAVDQIQTQRVKVTDTTALLRLDQITERARMTLALSVLIIVSAAAFAVMLLRLRFPTLVPIALIVAGVALAMALFFYIMDTNARVRTNGAHRYWQQPDLRTI